MGLARVQRGERFWYKNSAWEIIRVLPERTVMARNLTYGHEETLTWIDLSRAWRSGELRFEVKGKVARRDPDGVATQYQCVDLSTVDEKYREIAKVRYRLIQPLLDLPRGRRTKQLVKEHLARVRQNATPEEVKLLPKCYQTVYEFISAFESSGRDIRALVPRLGSRKRTRSQVSMELLTTVDAILEERWLRGERPPVHDVTELVMAQLAHDNQFRDPPVPIPKKHTLYMRIWRRVQELDAERVKRARHGDRAAEREYGYVKESPKPERILQTVQIDHTNLDLFVVDGEDRLPIGRPRITVCLDVFSGLPLGVDVGFEPPSNLAVGRCLRNAILPKLDIRTLYKGVVNEWPAYGVPETLIVDNSLEFIGKNMEDACLQLGIELVQAPVRCPEFKGAVERFFGSLNNQLLHALPGTTFSNILERGDYNSAENAVITLESFMEILHIFLVDYYAQRPNSKGVIPAQVWAQSARDYPPPLPWSKDDLNILLGSYEKRVVGRQGIEFLYLHYNSPSLAGLRAQLNRGRVKEPVKFNGHLCPLWRHDCPGPVSTCPATPEGPTRGDAQKPPCSDGCYRPPRYRGGHSCSMVAPVAAADSDQHDHLDRRFGHLRCFGGGVHSDTSASEQRAVRVHQLVLQLGHVRGVTGDRTLRQAHVQDANAGLRHLDDGGRSCCLCILLGLLLCCHV